MWEIIATQDEGSWLDYYISDVIANEPTPLPDHDLKIGHVEAYWEEVSPGEAFVVTNPDTGTPEDRHFVEAMIMEQLKPHGFKRATWTYWWDHDDMRKVAEWSDLEDKARRLIQSGQVRIRRNSQDTILANVTGDHGNYQCEIHRADTGNPNAITGSHCTCDWGQFQNLPRTRQWKRFQNRPCAHILAAWWQAQGLPTDEQRNPGGDNFGPNGQGQLFDMTPYAPNQNTKMWKNNPVIPPNAWFAQPDTPFAPGTPLTPDMMGQSQAPSPEDVLPQFPMGEQLQLPEVNPVSMPGGRPGPTPGNPIQYPGGTFSRFIPSGRTSRLMIMADQQYQNGQMVRTLIDDPNGTLVGRDQPQGFPEGKRPGDKVTIPKGAVCEVLGTDPTTGMVNVLWMGKAFDANSFFEPFGATNWYWPSQIAPASNTPPGPAIRRT